MMRESERRALVREAREKLATQFSDYFTTAHGLEYVRPLGKGSAAGALLFNDLEKQTPNKRVLRRVVVKYAFAEYENRNKMADDEIRNEFRWLRKLGGPEHIVQLITCEVDEEQIPRPALVLEFLEGGDVGQLCLKLRRAKRDMPNRVLWSIFLCLTRASVAMAYYPWTEGERETIPNNQQPKNLVHGDLHDENILLGALHPDDAEHRLAPRLKLIDFGKAGVIPPTVGITGPQQSVQDIGRVIIALVARRYSSISDENMQVNIQDDTGASHQILIYTDPAVRDATHLSAELRNVLFRSQAINPAERPSLDRLLQLCEAAVNTHTAAQYSNIPGYDHSAETNDSIRQFIQQFILDGDTKT
ncbi:kinase-like domain-containing protein [Camillea tinctor]|nr:kinase-like domain-containing protein [Camillea tinctor]